MAKSSISLCMASGISIIFVLLSFLTICHGAVNSAAVTGRKQGISPHSWQAEWRATVPYENGGPPPKTHFSYGSNIHKLEENFTGYGHSLVETGKERTKLVGLLEHEQMLAYSQNLQQAFKKYGKFTNSLGFLRLLFAQNPFLKFVTVRYSERVKIVNAIERAATRWTPARKDKAVAAEEVMASLVLQQRYTLRTSLLDRKAYLQSRRDILAALRAVNAGGHALDLILANKGRPIFSWLMSLWANPLATLSNVVSTAFDETFEGVLGLPTGEVKSACFSFGYRMNSIAPYTAVLPGGIFGSVLKSLSRSFMLVFYPAYASFRGIFSLMIGVICKTGVVAAAKNLFKALANVTRLGLRGIQILFRRFAVRNDPVAWPILQDLLRNASPAMITLLFQLYAVNVQDITQKGKRVTEALSAGTASWNYADGLWIGAFDFGRAFISTLTSYKQGAEAFVGYCEGRAMGSQPGTAEEQAMIDLISDESTAPGSDSDGTKSSSDNESEGGLSEEPLKEEILLAFHAIAPGVKVSPGETKSRLDTSCRRHRKFVQSFRRDPLKHIQTVVGQMVKILEYDYKFFKSYVGEVMSIFYETAYVLLNADITNVLSEKLPLESAGDQIQAAMANFQRYREAAAEAGKTSLPRKMFREPWFVESGTSLAHGFFQSGAGLALHFVVDDMGDETLRNRRDSAAFSLLNKGAQKLRKAVKSLYGRFLEANLLIRRLESNKSVKTVQDFISKCNPRLGVPDPEVCGKVVTAEVDANLFVKEALYSLSVPMAVSPDDIAALNDSAVGDVFARWRDFSKLSRDNQAVADGASDRKSMGAFLQHLRQTIVGRLVFIRFDFTDEFTKLTLHDANGRSIQFTPDDADDVRALSGRQEGKSTKFRPPPLNTSCWFHLEEGNRGTLQFPIVSEGVAIEGIQPATGAGAPAEGIPAHKIPGHIKYNDPREELASIQDDPAAVRDVIVAKFFDVYGRAPAEMMASLLLLIHSKTESFWSHSPSVFMQNVTPKMFFDTLLALSTTAKTRPPTSVMLEGRLYTFPLSFVTVKSIFLGAINRLIVRMHSLDSKDIISVFMMTVAYMAYQKIQKHRTGKTLVMNLYQREVLHLHMAQQRGELLTEAPHCAWLEEGSQTVDEFIVKCAALRYFKMGSVDNIEEADKEHVRNFVSSFADILDSVRGSTRWMDFLNIDTFAAEAELYGKTAAKYSYDKLLQELSVEYAEAGEGESLAKMYTEIHPALGGPKRYIKERQSLVTALRSYVENIKHLPQSLRKKLGVFIRACHGKLRRFVGAKQLALFRKIRPNVLHGTTFFAAVQGAEGRVFPNPELRSGLFIEALDLLEYGRLQLAFEELAVLLSDSHSMQSILSELRSVPVQTIEARDEYKKLKSRIETLPMKTVEAAAGWALRYLSEGKGGMELAVGMLALKNPEGGQLSKALQLSFAGVEVLTFLNSSLNVAHVLEFFERATSEDMAHLRISLGVFKASAQTESRSTAMSLQTKYSVVQSISNTLDALELLNLPLEGRTMFELCDGLLRNAPEIFFNGSMVSVNMDDHVVLCYILSELLNFQQTKEDEISPQDLVQSTRVDGKPVGSFLEDLVNTSIKTEARLTIANAVSPFFRGVLIAFMGHEVGHLAAAQFASVDLTTGVLSFIIANVIEFSNANPANPLTPADVFRKTARLALGAENPTEEGSPQIVAASVSYPPCLGDWYTLLDHGKLEELTKDPTSLTGEALADASASNRLTDLVDVFYIMRQSSTLRPHAIIAKARDILMGNESLPLLDRAGLTVFVSGFLKLAEKAKVDCLQEAMDDITGYLPLTRQEQYLYKCDCFYKKLADGAAAPEAAKNISKELLKEAFNAIETAHAAKAGELYNLILSSPNELPRALERGLEYLLYTPVLSFGQRVAEEVVLAIAQHSDWDSLNDRLQLLKEVKWSLTERSPLRKRSLNKDTRPKFFNPILIAADMLAFIQSGIFERRRFPKPLVLKRIAATSKIIVRRIRPTTEGQERAIRVATANKLREELGGLAPPQEISSPVSAEEPSGAPEPILPSE